MKKKSRLKPGGQEKELNGGGSAARNAPANTLEVKGSKGVQKILKTWATRGILEHPERLGGKDTESGGGTKTL